MKKKCIFHYPMPFDYDKKNGSSLRPISMLEAFKECGYDVDVISGYGNERKDNIKKIKSNIKNGTQYDFLYSESLTQPTLLSEKNHIPRYPFLDFRFLKLCRKNNIPVFLYYRDMHWKFAPYKEGMIWYKKMITLPLYKYDLYQYYKNVDILYCPTEKFIEFGLNKYNIKALPPGCKINSKVTEYKMNRMKTDNIIHVFYVGGVAGIYDISLFLRGMMLCDRVFLTICTPKDHWNENKQHLQKWMNERVTVVHKNSNQLEGYYKNSDVSLFCKAQDVYTDMAVPIKTKETLGYGTPIIVSDNLAVAKDVKEGGYGWIVKPEPQAIKELLEYLCNNPNEINEKTHNAIQAARDNTWKSRAEQVIKDSVNWKGNNDELFYT